MTCPACGEVLTPGQERCSFCEAVVSPHSDGALAPQPTPASLTPPPRPRAEPIRELPGTRKRERTWKDEVSERVQHRRRRRAGLPELPLFERTEEASPATPEPPPELRELKRPDLLEAAVADLPLRPLAPALPEERSVAMPEPEAALADRPPAEIRPVERPAFPGERLRAAAVDLLFVAVMWAVVVYFAGRAAHVPVLGLRPNWPYLAAYLAFLGLAYAAYFTGTTGQTPGKMAIGVRVVDTAGQPPGYVRALVRAALGALSVVAAGLGLLPMAFDPARRAVHDRLFRTRVVKH